MIHDHCRNCYYSNCGINGQPTNADANEESCEVVHCPSGCSSMLHKCKVIEHQKYICSSFVIPCVNKSYGCPHSFPRFKLTAHLLHCPAHVISCKVEWNRLHSGFVSKESIPLDEESLCSQISTDILDVALAKRDQQMLEEALELPRTLLSSLRNNFTVNFPAVPIVNKGAKETGHHNCANEHFDALDLLSPVTKNKRSTSESPPGKDSLELIVKYFPIEWAHVYVCLHVYVCFRIRFWYFFIIFEWTVILMPCICLCSRFPLVYPECALQFM